MPDTRSPANPTNRASCGSSLRLLQLAVEQLGDEVVPPFVPTEDRLRCIMEHYGINESELLAVSSSDSLESRYKALEGCVASRVSMVSLES